MRCPPPPPLQLLLCFMCDPKPFFTCLVQAFLGSGGGPVKIHGLLLRILLHVQYWPAVYVHVAMWHVSMGMLRNIKQTESRSLPCSRCTSNAGFD